MRVENERMMEAETGRGMAQGECGTREEENERAGGGERERREAERERERVKSVKKRKREKKGINEKQETHRQRATAKKFHPHTAAIRADSRACLRVPTNKQTTDGYLWMGVDAGLSGCGAAQSTARRHIYPSRERE